MYEYQITRYNQETGEGGIFANYINKFLKLKAETSGYPSWVRTPNDQDQYRVVSANEGILDRLYQTLCSKTRIDEALLIQCGEIL